MPLLRSARSDGKRASVVVDRLCVENNLQVVPVPPPYRTPSRKYTQQAMGTPRLGDADGHDYFVLYNSVNSANVDNLTDKYVTDNDGESHIIITKDKSDKYRLAYAPSDEWQHCRLCDTGTFM